ncbi:MAG: serine hydrolase [Cyanobacteria bacterium REEB459]|nr:serine hydrolase [Cyanobacteria bacterium REEB459]
MAQFGDPNSASSSQGSGYGQVSSAPPQGVNPSQPNLLGNDRPQPETADGSLRPSLVSRRRNQWRQYKHMKHEYETRSEANGVDPSPPKRLDNPDTRFLTMPVLPARSRPPSREQAAPAERPLRVNPQTQIDRAVPLSRSVSPLVRGARRPPGQASELVPKAPHHALSPRLEPPAAAMDSRSPDRPRRSRSRGPGLPKTSLPLLYLIRLIILGVGIAAIAGTLLAAFSPARQASSIPQPSQGITAQQLPASRTDSGSSAGINRVDDVKLTDELTRFKAQIEQLITLTPGLTPSLFALDLDSGHYIDLKGSQSMAAASTIKVPILIAFLQQVDSGAMSLNQTLVLKENQIASGSGSMANDPVGTQYSALDVATRMIIHSDNTATNMLIEALGGQEALNQRFADWGLGSTILHNALPDLQGTNTTSAHDLALLMALIDQGGLLSPRSRDRMLSIMQRTASRSLIPKGIGAEDGTIVANKTGDIATSLGDVALVDTANGRRYVLAILVQRPDNDGRASELIRRVAEATQKELNQPVVPVGRPAADPSSGSADSTFSPPSGGQSPDRSSQPSVPYQPANPPAGPAPGGDQVPPG